VTNPSPLKNRISPGQIVVARREFCLSSVRRSYCRPSLCYSVDSPKHPGVSFMLENAHITRVDVDGSAMATAEGIRVGDTEARVKQVYGSRLKVEPNAYSGSADPVLTMRSADGRYGIRFITKKRKVRLIYAGRWQSIQYIEGCE
jgi:hypothetical protein